MLRQDPSLAIVIPAFNEESTIGKCLDSIKCQSVRPNEVIVVDNNSTDNTARIAQKYTFVTLISEPRQGIAYAHGTGYDLANSKFIARIDADSILPNNWVASVKDYYQDPAHNSTTMSGSGYGHNVNYGKISGLMIDSAFICSRLALGHYPLWGPNLVMPKHVWMSINSGMCCKEDIFDDLDIALHINSLGLPIKWNRNLRVGVRVSNLESYPRYFSYNQKWSRTLKNHSMKRWLPIAVSLGIVSTFQYPFCKILRK